MPLFLMGCFPVDFQEAKRPLGTKSGKRPIKVGKRPIKEGKRPIKAMVLVGISMGCFRAPPPWRKTAPLKRPIWRSMNLALLNLEISGNFRSAAFLRSCEIARAAGLVVEITSQARQYCWQTGQGIGVLSVQLQNVPCAAAQLLRRLGVFQRPLTCDPKCLLQGPETSKLPKDVRRGSKIGLSPSTYCWLCRLVSGMAPRRGPPFFPNRSPNWLS